MIAASECAKYHKVAQKQKQGFEKYLKTKKHVCVRDLIDKRKQKATVKLAEQLDRQKI